MDWWFFVVLFNVIAEAPSAMGMRSRRMSEGSNHNPERGSAGRPNFAHVHKPRGAS